MSEQRQSRPGLIWLIVVVLACAVGLGLKSLGTSFRTSRTPPPVAQDAPQIPQQATASVEDAELKPVGPGESQAKQPVAGVVQTVARTASTASTEPRIEPTPYTRQLVSSLTNLDFTQGAVTPEQAQQWKQSLQALAAQGAAAVPAIREFLDQNKEVVFGASGGQDLLGQPSMRSAFINTLAQINGPEATAALVQTLQTSTLPTEIAQLAQALDQRAPGQYRQETLAAINEVLNMASNGQLPSGWDVGALFKTLQAYGDTSTASSLEQLQGPFKYYSTLALAGIEGGDGVPVLVRETQDATGGSRRDFAYQMLAQVAAQYPDASTALLEQAKANQISDAAWAKIATGLAGDQYQIGQPAQTAGVDSFPIEGLKTFHIGSGNQNFYSLPLAAGPQIQQRIALVDQLMGATSSPNALAALQTAKATLSGMIAN